MEMNEESILAWNIIEKTNANLFLTGKAGTGKTTFLKRLKRMARREAGRTNGWSFLRR